MAKWDSTRSAAFWAERVLGMTTLLINLRTERHEITLEKKCIVFIKHSFMIDSNNLCYLNNHVNYLDQLLRKIPDFGLSICLGHILTPVKC